MAATKRSETQTLTQMPNNADRQNNQRRFSKHILTKPIQQSVTIREGGSTQMVHLIEKYAADQE